MGVVLVFSLETATLVSSGVFVQIFDNWYAQFIIFFFLYTLREEANRLLMHP
jgi:hypothetical protein